MTSPNTFGRAIEFLFSQSTVDCRKLSFALRREHKVLFGEKLSVKEADVYVKQYREICLECYELAAINLVTNDKQCFEKNIFDHYPKIDEKLKSKWVKESYLAVFR